MAVENNLIFQCQTQNEQQEQTTDIRPMNLKIHITKACKLEQ